MLIDAEQLIHYQRCRRRAFLDVYGDLSQRDAPNEYLLKLIHDSRANHKFVLSKQVFSQPKYPVNDWEAGAQATLALMQQGVDRIYQGVLLAEGEAGARFKVCLMCW